MTGPAPALVQLRQQVDARWPRRSRRSDGIMGDAAHRRRRSAHNSGDAFDVTNDPANGPRLDVMIPDLAQQMRANPDGRIAVLIWRRRIWSRRTLFRPVPYFGSNPHTSHAHIEVRRSHRHITRPWTLRG